MYREDGEAVWSCELNSYGKVRNFQGEFKTECPFRFQGQYHDNETGLYYNRFRYYDPESGSYLSQDPIRLAGGLGLYSYVHDVNSWIDIFGQAKHHTIPREVYNPRTNKKADGSISRKDPVLPSDVADNKEIRGTRKNPNMWNVPDDVHANIHDPKSDISKKNFGDYNKIFKERVRKLGDNVTAEDVLKIRDQMAKEYDIDKYRKKSC